MTYPFARGQSEHDRLISQGAFFDPLTRDLLSNAGLAPGMRVLDLGTGAGNVARIAAELVGPAGHVLGIDADSSAVDLATADRPRHPTSSTARPTYRRSTV